jgi:hypothetical protein
MVMTKSLSPYLPGILLFLIAFVIGITTCADYGISWDEPIQRSLGITTYNYVFHNDNALLTDNDRGLGTGFELPLIFIEKALRLRDTRDIYLARHLATHIFFLFAAFCAYLLAYRLFKEKFIACLAFIMIAFCPRIYAHSYFNSKDIPFLSAFLIALLVSLVAFEKNKYSWYFILGIATGYATSIRSMGILLAICILLFLNVDLLTAFSRKEKIMPVINKIILFVIGFFAMLYFSWPVLWRSPVHNFIDEFRALSHIKYGGEVCLNGTIYPGNNLPWQYMLIWFPITVPELWLISGLIGILCLLYGVLNNPLKYIRNTKERNFVLHLLCFIAPVAAMTLLNGVNIDDWRHIYFIYPSFVILALFTINKLAVRHTKIVVQLGCVAQVGLIAFFMIKYHPFQQIYFNSFVFHKEEYLRDHYDMDYWGCSFKQGVEYILTKNPNGKIKIASRLDWPLKNNLMLLPDNDQKRIDVVSVETANYFIDGCYRGHPYGHPYPVEYSIKVLNSSILNIYKTR